MLAAATVEIRSAVATAAYGRAGTKFPEGERGGSPLCGRRWGVKMNFFCACAVHGLALRCCVFRGKVFSLYPNAAALLLLWPSALRAAMSGIAPLRCWILGHPFIVSLLRSSGGGKDSLISSAFYRFRILRSGKLPGHRLRCCRESLSAGRLPRVAPSPVFRRFLRRGRARPSLS